MLFHKFDPITKIYTESVEAELQPEHYTVAFIDGEFVSVLKPELEIVDNEIKKIEKIEQ